MSHFKNKTVYCNCDDPDYSNFYFFFREQFKWYGLKKLITTHYKKDGSSSYKTEFILKKGEIVKIETPLKENGDFRSNECIELLKESDIVVTNPPFSLFGDYINQLIDYNKKFLIIGPISAVTRKEIFKLFKDNKIWLGFGFHKAPTFYTMENNVVNKDAKFTSPCYWYTNLENSKRNEELILWKSYNSDDFPKYDNFDAINVDKVVEIPKDYKGLMGVPITFLDKYNPNQFEIVTLMRTGMKEMDFINIKKLEYLNNWKPTGKFTTTNGDLFLKYNKKSKKPPQYIDEQGNYYQCCFKRIIIRNKQI